MNALEYIWWSDFFEVRPFGDIRDDLRAALTCRLLLTPFTKSGTPLKMTDLMLQPPVENYPDSNILANKCITFFGGSKNG